MMGLGFYKVTGDSMLPSYCSGDYVLTFRFNTSRLSVGDVLVVRHSRYGNIIKRIKRIERVEDDGSTFAIAGDNTQSSTDSDTLGLVSIKQVLGKVIWHIAGP
mgnify:CR=1 FL=1